MAPYNTLPSPITEQPHSRPGYVDYRDDFSYPDRGVSFHWWENLRVNPHCHNHYEFFIVTSGQIEHIINGHRQLLEPNSLCFVKPTDTHQLGVSTREPARHLNVAVTEDVLRMMCGVLSPKMYSILESFDHFSTSLTEKEVTFFIEKTEQLNMSKNNYIDDLDSRVMLINEMLLFALTIIYNRNQQVHTECSELYPQWFAEMLQQLHSPEYFSRPMADLYALSHYSPPVLLRYFKKYTGQTPVSYITKIKINHACSLLNTTNFTTLDIANMVGYDSLSHFNKIFRKNIGMSPGAYRQNSRAQRTE